MGGCCWDLEAKPRKVLFFLQFIYCRVEIMLGRITEDPPWMWVDELS